MSRQRVSAIIIQDKKILLVHEKDIDHRSTPGGGIEDDETHEDTLRRELNEELGITVDTMKLYSTFTGTNIFYQMPQTDYCYSITFSGTPRVGSTVHNLGRFSKDELKAIPIAQDQQTGLIAEIIRNGLL